MRLVTFNQNGENRIGAIRDEQIVDLNATDASLPTDMLALIQGGDEMLQRANSAAKSGSDAFELASATLRSPLLLPPRILAIGMNYMDHFYEIPEAVRTRMGMTGPSPTPIMFNKQNTSITGPYDPVYLPPESPELDYEAELALIIGKACRRVPAADAFSVIMGYSVLNDVSVRDWQRAAPTMTMGKSWDSHCPLGPAIVTADEVAEPENLAVRTLVDGEERQSFNTGEMIHKIATQIEYLSTAFTLLPGDVIATGTSAGVALFREGQPWLREGQSVRVEIEGLGFLENKVIADPNTPFTI
ncbi:MAG: fumarylacetoacetate hydrolase family protein [Pseudomonadota bacterium]